MAISVTSNRLRRLSLASFEFLDLALQFEVDRLQLLVDRLRLLARGFELLVGRLQFLVDRDQLLVRRFQLLERGLVFLDRAIAAARAPRAARVRAARRQLVWPFERRRQPPVGRQRTADIAKDDQEQRLGIVVGQRLDPQIQELDAVLDLDVQPWRIDRRAALDRLGQRRPQVQPQPAPRHRDDVAARRAGSVFEIFAGPRREMDDVAVARDDDMRRRELLDDPAFDDVPQRQCR